MADNQTKRCDACGVEVTYTGHRGFMDAHRDCSKRGHNAADDTHTVCPQHGTLVWVVGPYSAFRACAERNCTAGKRGKPWRYCAPRGEYATPTDSETRRQERDRIARAIGEQVTNQIRGQEATEYHVDELVAMSTPTNGHTESTGMTSASTVNAKPDTVAALNALLATLQPAAPTVDEATIRALVDAAVEKRLANTVKVTLIVESAPESRIEIDAPHPCLQRVIKLVNAGLPVYLWGPAGGGKTTAGQQVARALNRECEIDTLDPSTFRSMVQGYCTPTGDPVHTSFTRCWTSGKIYIGDEADNGPGHVQTLFNSALANGHAPLAWGNVARGESFGFIATGNTPGRPTREFPDRKPMSAAFADRLYFVHWPLDEQAERAWSGVGGKGKAIKCQPAREIAADAWVDFVQRLREWCSTNAPTIMITPRASIVGLKALACGESPEQVADGLIFRGADSELRTKALTAVKLP